MPTQLPPRTGMLTTRFADEQVFEENQFARKNPGPEAGMVDALMRMIRSASITAAPPAHIRPTVWSDSIDQTVQVTLPAAAGAYTVAASVTIPMGRGARIEQYGVNVLDNTFTYDGSILWAFRKNGTLLPLGLSNWGEQRGTMVFPRKTVIILDAKDKLDFLVRRAVAAGAPQNIQMGFRGWTWRKRNNSQGTQSSVTAY